MERDSAIVPRPAGSAPSRCYADAFRDSEGLPSGSESDAPSSVVGPGENVRLQYSRKGNRRSQHDRASKSWLPNVCTRGRFAVCCHGNSNDRGTKGARLVDGTRSQFPLDRAYLDMEIYLERRPLYGLSPSFDIFCRRTSFCFCPRPCLVAPTRNTFNGVFPYFRAVARAMQAGVPPTGR